MDSQTGIFLCDTMDNMDKEKTVCLQVLQTCRNELCEMLPHLDSAFAHLRFDFCGQRGFRTDGEAFSAYPRDLLALYAKAPEVLRRGYLHTLLHCLYLHLFADSTGDARRWNLACDMAVEQILQRETFPRLCRKNPVAEECLAILGEDALSAEQICARLQHRQFPYSLEQMEAAFRFDDHSGWTGALPSGSRSKWERLLLEASGKKSGKGKRGSSAGSGEERCAFSGEEPYDYRAFLRRFTTAREEVELDPESFDYGFYHFGLTHYGSMPLIEPLEYREVRRLEELVIAIDTSGSCSAQTVSRFLSETYSILASQENFFRKMNVYFLQCDCVIQDVARITSREEWLSYADRIRIQGRGGTDFTPVFGLVQELRTSQKLTNLKALLYFTDGDGVYPTQPPDYETAFVLLKDTGHRELVPPWGTLLLI